MDTSRRQSTDAHVRGRRFRAATLTVALLASLTMTVAGCGCPAALLPGVLVAQGSELAIREDPSGFLRPVRWPFGYGTRQDADGLVLTDLFGNIKAREGDHVSLPGGETSSDGPWGVCGELVVAGAT